MREFFMFWSFPNVVFSLFRLFQIVRNEWTWAQLQKNTGACWSVSFSNFSALLQLFTLIFIVKIIFSFYLVQYSSRHIRTAPRKPWPITYWSHYASVSNVFFFWSFYSMDILKCFFFSFSAITTSHVWKSETGLVMQILFTDDIPMSLKNFTKTKIGQIRKK